MVACVYTRGITVGSVTVMALFGMAILLSPVVLFSVLGSLQRRLRHDLNVLSNSKHRSKV